MLVSRIKPCKSQSKWINSGSADGLIKPDTIHKNHCSQGSNPLSIRVTRNLVDPASSHMLVSRINVAAEAVSN